ncbi:phenylalanine--tRNA ligase subunit beta [Patescibacteria group bacterium]|nr:phenylalanine--tRNA ligase subunit beta [Patescibacteria group bacterium]
MYLSLDWIKEWVKLPKDIKPEKLALDFTMSTVEVEEIIDKAQNLENVVVGKIEEITKHPDADRLHVCQVNLAETTEQIVCGGENLSKGMLVAVAKPGSKVKWHGQGELVSLEKTKIRGVESNGMIAAAEELGLGDLFPQKSEKEIIDLTNLKLKVGQDLAQALKLNDLVIDIDNKSINHRPDLWGQYGLARELAAIYKLKLKAYALGDLKTKSEVKLKVDVKDKENCFRYMGLIIKNITVADSPWWLKKRLESVGIRPINNIVDVTNYVMYELGQPMHAFDSSHIEDHHIVIKQAAKGEKFVTLDGESRKLPEGALMIADSHKYVALAGIMGGQNSEISADTTDIILESANFKASSIRHTSVAMGLRSESSARFEKSLDPLLAELAIKKAVQMILSFCPEAYTASSLVDINNNPFKEINLEVSEELINKRFGVVIPTIEIKDILKRLQFEVKYKAKIFYITVPSFRATKDISIPEDIVEEVARIYGYDNIQASLPAVEIVEPKLDLAHQAQKNIKRWFSFTQAYNEVYNYPFTDQAWAKKIGLELNEHIKVKNTLSPEQSYLNMSLLPNLLARAEENLRWFDEFKIYELERIFDKRSKGVYQTDNSQVRFLPKQDKYLSGVEVSKANQRDLFLSIKGMLESLMEYINLNVNFEEVNFDYAYLAYNIKHQDIVLGNFGILSSDLFDSGGAKVNIAFFQINFSLLVKYINKVKKYQPLPKFPAIYRDMAIVVEKDLRWQDISREVSKVSALIKNLEPFDEYSDNMKTGTKSLAFHIEFRSSDRTLLSEDIDKIMKQIQDILAKKFNASLR